MAALPPPRQQTVDAIYAHYEANAQSGYREHLGASLIGRECERELWFSFRWATRAKHAGRLLRLFETGQLAEARFVANLRAIGVTVHDVDPETGEQFRMRDETGHFGGSMDGAGIGFSEALKTWHVIEFKTHSEKSFGKLKANGVAKAKPEHFAQMQVYMHLSGMERAFYLAVNKNTDELYQERIYYDAAFAARLMAKAARIILSKRAPVRPYISPEFVACKFCDHRGTCWHNVHPERHCRSCVFSTPVQGGGWQCEHPEQPLGALDRDAQIRGCLNHLLIPDFVAGDVIEANQSAITYRMHDGSEWTDERVPL